MQINTSNMYVLEGDGTNSNIGWKDGSMVHMKRLLNRPCQRVVYLLHHCELPFFKLFELIYGSTYGSNSFNGSIGKLIAKDI